jgi:hypothetical protein
MDIIGAKLEEEWIEMTIDWKDLANQIGDLNPDGSEKGNGTESGIRALEIIIGESNIRGAVDKWVSQESGAFTAEKALIILGSTVAMERCYEIYKSDPASYRAGAALFLLAEMADFRVLPWVSEFLDDRNQGIRWNGLMALRNIFEGPMGDEDIAVAKGLLAKAESDCDQRLRERAIEIRQQLAANSRSAPPEFVREN